MLNCCRILKNVRYIVVLIWYLQKNQNTIQTLKVCIQFNSDSFVQFLHKSLFLITTTTTKISNQKMQSFEK